MKPSYLAPSDLDDLDEPFAENGKTSRALRGMLALATTVYDDSTLGASNGASTRRPPCRAVVDRARAPSPGQAPRRGCGRCGRWTPWSRDWIRDTMKHAADLIVFGANGTIHTGVDAVEKWHEVRGPYISGLPTARIFSRLGRWLWRHVSGPVVSHLGRSLERKLELTTREDR